MSPNNQNSSLMNTIPAASNDGAKRVTFSFSFENLEDNDIDFSPLLQPPPPPPLRRQTTVGECYHCGACPENKEIEYRCWSCNKFATPLAASAMWKTFQRKGTGWPNGPNNWWKGQVQSKPSWYVWTRRWNNLPKSNLNPYWAQKHRLKKMNDLINIW